MTMNTSKKAMTTMALGAVLVSGSVLALGSCAGEKHQAVNSNQAVSSTQKGTAPAQEQVSSLTDQNKIDILKALKLRKDGANGDIDELYKRVTGKGFDKIRLSQNADTTMKDAGLIIYDSDHQYQITDKGLKFLEAKSVSGSQAPAKEQVSSLTDQDKIDILKAYKLRKDGAKSEFADLYEGVTGQDYAKIEPSFIADKTMENAGLITCSNGTGCQITDKGLKFLEAAQNTNTNKNDRATAATEDAKPSKKELEAAYEQGLKKGEDAATKKMQDLQRQAADQAKPGSLAPAQQQSNAPQGSDQYGQGANTTQPQQQAPAQQNQNPQQQYNYQQGQDLQQAAIQQQPIYVQQPVVIEGYGTLGVGYGIPACPWYPWQSPYAGYPYELCYGNAGWGYPFLWWNRGWGWGRGFYGAGEFGRYFGRNIASRSYGRNNYGRSYGNNNNTRGQSNNTRGQGSSTSRGSNSTARGQQQRGQGSTRQPSGTQRQNQNGFNHFNGRQGSPQNQNHSNQQQSQNRLPNLRGQTAQRNGSMQRQNPYNNMLRQQPNQQRMQQQYHAPQQQFHAQQAPQFHAPQAQQFHGNSAPHFNGGGNIPHAGGGGGGHSGGGGGGGGHGGGGGRHR